jgi:PAS domain S-box-containing protein
MSKLIKILFVEDLPSDMELAELELHKGGVSFTSMRVDSERDLDKALKEFHPDIVISDYSMPGFDGMQALRICLESDPDTPVIMLTGSMRENVAVECMKAGATDYVIKEHITRLPFSVFEALEMKRIRIVNEKANIELRKSELRFKQISENFGEWIWELDKNGLYTYSSDVVKEILGYKKEDIVGKKYFYDFFVPEERDQLKKIAFNAFNRKERFRNFTNRNLHKDGRVIILSTSGLPVFDTDANFIGYRGVDTDITRSKNSEEELLNTKNRLLSLFEYSPIPIREEDFSEVKKYFDELRSGGVNDLRQYLSDNPEDILKCASMIRILDMNREAIKIFEATNREEISKDLSTFFSKSSNEIFKEELIALFEGNSAFEGEIPIILSSGLKKELFIRLSVIPGFEDTLSRILVSFIDISERKIAEEKLAEVTASEKARSEDLENSNLELRIARQSSLNITEDLYLEIEYRKEVEKKIRETQLILESILESPKEMFILSIDRNFNLMNFNSVYKNAMHQLYRIVVRPGMNLLECLTNKKDRIKVKSNYARALKGESHIAIDKFGGYGRFYETRYNPISNEEGEIIGATSFSANITSRIEAEKQIRKSGEMLEELNRHLTTVRENERAIISREIHDQLGQSMTALKMDMNSLRQKLSTDIVSCQKLDKMIDLITATIKDVQRISAELRPGILDDLGLSAAVDWYCDEFAKRTGLEVHLDLDEVQSDNMNENLTVYRVLQESLTNIIRHARAKNVIVKLAKIKNSIVLSVTDDGIGIGKDKINAPGSLGLMGMFERVKQSGGRMKISSTGNNGTNVQIYVPIKNT